jgi:stage II sporulation protein M
MLRPDQEKKALEFVLQALKDINLQGSPLVLALTLFYHNIRASVVAVAAGVVPFLFLPILDPLLNGGVLGLLVSVTKHQGLDVPRLILTKILPHGVFELTAVLYSTSLGLYLSAGLGRKAVAAWRKKRGQPQGQPPPAPNPTNFLETYPARAAEPESLARNVVRSFVLVVLPLLLIAAFIEGFITPSLR